MFLKNLNRYWRVAVCLSIFIAAAGFIADAIYTSQYGGVDLRNRVTGTRVAVELKQDPYHYKWMPGQSDRYFDPSDNAAIGVSRLTVTPAVITLYSTFTPLPYTYIRYFWFVVQWACLIASICILMKLSGDAKTRAAILILGLLGISGSAFWRLHVERGQMYILYVFIFCLALYLYKKYQDKINLPLIASGVLLGWLITLRPPYVFALIPLFLYKKYKFLGVILGGITATVLISSFLSPVPLWKTYYNAMQEESALRLDETINFRGYESDAAEGVELKKFLAVPGEDSSLQTIFRGIFNRWFTSTQLFVLLVLFTAGVAGWMWKFKIPHATAEELFFMGGAMTFFAEFFIAAQRWPYANVIWLIPISLMILLYKKITPSALTYTVGGLIVLGFLSQIGLHLIPRFSLFGDAGIPFATLLFLFILTRERARAT